MDFVSKIANLRGPDDSFGVVTKSLSQLHWNDFEHMNGRLNVGVSSDSMKQNRVIRKRKVWKNVQSQWLACSHMAYDMIRHMCALKNGNLVAAALIEDGMFEENIMYPAALYSEMLWDCNCELSDIIKNVSQRSYVTFA